MFTRIKLSYFSRRTILLRCHSFLPCIYLAINEKDGLSHKVCVKCLGTLEFLCDFHDQCHKTQERLAEAKEFREREKIDVQTELNSYDSDKENVAPITKTGMKRQKRIDPDILSNGKTSNSSTEKCHKVKVQEPDRSRAETKLNGSVKTNRDEDALTKISETNENNDNDSKCRVKTNTSNDTLSTRKSAVENDRNRDCARSEQIPVIVKLEKTDNSCAPADPKREILLRQNKIVWIPNILQLPEGDSPKCPRMETSHAESPPAGDEAEKHEGNCGRSNENKKKITATMEVARRRRSVVEKTEVASSRETHDAETNCRENRESRVTRKKVKKDEIVMEIDDEESTDDIGEIDHDKSTAGSKRFNKITDLMSDEQKEAIEKYYVCDMSAVDESVVNEHLDCLDKKKFRCKLCGASYGRQDKCHVHIWGHLAMKPYRCNACNFSTVTVSNIRCHVRKSHLKIKPYVCEYCEKRYVTAFLLDEHMNTHTGSRPYACDTCDFKSASRQVLAYHKTTHKPVKDITCNVCGKEFYSKGRLRAHMIIHDKNRIANMCKLCSIYLCNSEALQKHYANVHSKDYECDVCGKRCKSKKALNNHSNVHSAAKYKCNLCSNVYKSSHILKEHLLKHEGIRKYKCNICRKDFAQQSHLAAHMAVHSDKRFFCPGCKRPFNRHDNMKMHTKRCEPFLANPELVKILTVRRSRTEGFPTYKDETIESRKTVDVSSSSSEFQNTKTDFNTKEEKERTVETFKVRKNRDEFPENFTTITVESTIPCT